MDYWDVARLIHVCQMSELDAAQESGVNYPFKVYMAYPYY
jgi:hypothetical protein